MREALSAKFRDRVAEAGWHVIVEARLGPEREAYVDFAILAPSLGIALVDLLPRETSAPRAALWRRLRAAGFTEADRAILPVIYRRLPPAGVEAFVNRLPRLFVQNANVALPDDWLARAEQAIAPGAAARTYSPGLASEPAAGDAPAAAEPYAEPAPAEPRAPEHETVAAIAAAPAPAPRIPFVEHADAKSGAAELPAGNAVPSGRSGAASAPIERPQPPIAEPVAAGGDSAATISRSQVPRFGFAEDAAFRFPDQPLAQSGPGTAGAIVASPIAAVAILPSDPAPARPAAARRMPPPPKPSEGTASDARRDLQRGVVATLLLGAVAAMLFWSGGKPQPDAVASDGTAALAPIDLAATEPLPLPWPPGWFAGRNAGVIVGATPGRPSSEPPQAAPPPLAVPFAPAGQTELSWALLPVPPAGDPPAPVPPAIIVPSPPEAPLPEAASAWLEPLPTVPLPPSREEIEVVALPADAARQAVLPLPTNSGGSRPDTGVPNSAATRAARTAEIGAEANCLDLLRRLQLGDHPSHADLDLLRRNCRPRR